MRERDFTGTDYTFDYLAQYIVWPSDLNQEKAYIASNSILSFVCPIHELRSFTAIVIPS